MKRGEVWTVSDRLYAGKPRPAVIVQDDRFLPHPSVAICAFTTDPAEAPLFRPLIVPHATNGLDRPCHIMADKITSVPRAKFGARLGELGEADMEILDTALLVFLGLAAPRPRAAG